MTSEPQRAPSPPRRSALVQQVIENLQYGISAGRWPVGSKLPLEAELLEEYQVSRVTLRQAVQALVHVGMLETIQGSGTFVRASHELHAVLARFLDGEELRHLLEARLAIEAQAAELAAAHATSEEIDELAEVLARSRAAATSGDIDALAPLSARFHRGVVVAAHNPVLTQLYSPLADDTEHTIREATSPRPMASFVDEHATILEAISRGDGEAAFVAARSHLAGVLHEQAERSRAPGVGPSIAAADTADQE
ncbi:FadR/GntR family transcriptional regulator [Tsukamurella tyrosinosolvens]|uniref:FadR/GntR family transcriptional regulator n=1 Tax=Tsukamurella tyrosinosolvens TaxID=57704 RepID=UPI0036BE3C34